MPNLTKEQWDTLLRVVDYYVCDESIRLIDEQASDAEWEKLQQVKDIVVAIDNYTSQHFLK